MTAAVKTAPANAHLSAADGPVITCTNPECNLELSRTEKALSVRRNGLCAECFTDGVTVPEQAATPQPVTAPEPAEQAAEETHEETAARLATIGLDPETGDVVRCGQCDANIARKVADNPAAEYCSPMCETAAVRAAALAIAVEIVTFAYPDITEYQAETGLKAAMQHWSNGKVAGRGIAAAARAWTSRDEDYSQMHYGEQGRANSRALPILKSAVRAAREYLAAHLPA